MWGGHRRVRGEGQGCHFSTCCGCSGHTDGLVESYGGHVAGVAAGTGSRGEWTWNPVRASGIRERPTVSHLQSLSTLCLSFIHMHACARTHSHMHTHTQAHTPVHTQAHTGRLRLTSVPTPGQDPPAS